MKDVKESDVNIRLARAECANFINGICVNGSPCLIVTGKTCTYFAEYVHPLLDLNEFASKYSREARNAKIKIPKVKAKIAVAATTKETKTKKKN